MQLLVSHALHVTAALGAFAALGSICLSERHGKGATILHGVSLLLLLLLGLHLLFAKELVKSGGWWHTKIVLWLVLGAAPALAKRKLQLKLPQENLLYFLEKHSPEESPLAPRRPPLLFLPCRARRDHPSCPMNDCATRWPLVCRVWKSTIGRKLLVALTGLILTLFLAGHLAGNLLVYVGREAFNDYAEFLHHMLHGAGVWIARAVLLTAVAIHIAATISLTRENRAAR